MGELNAYIDEAGDEGFVFRNPASGKSGSSRWFVIVAVVVDSAKDRAVAKAVHRIKQRLWGKVDERPLHWVDLSHSKRKVCIEEIQKEPFSLFAVALNKADPDLDQQKLNPQKVKPPGLALKNSLYFYCAEHLLGMVYNAAELAKVSVNLVFENRHRLSAVEVRNRLSSIVRLPQIGDVRVESKQACKMLQVADACAGALYSAVEPDTYGNIEDSHVRGLASRFYGAPGKLWRVGIKLLPTTMTERVRGLPTYHWMREIW